METVVYDLKVDGVSVAFSVDYQVTTEAFIMGNIDS
jgi:hypothetical protein